MAGFLPNKNKKDNYARESTSGAKSSNKVNTLTSKTASMAGGTTPALVPETRADNHVRNAMSNEWTRKERSPRDYNHSN